MRKMLGALVGGSILGMFLLAPPAAHAQIPVKTGVLIQPYIQIGNPAPVRERPVIIVKERRPEHHPYGWYRRQHQERFVYVRERREGRHEGRHEDRREGWRK